MCSCLFHRIHGVYTDTAASSKLPTPVCGLKCCSVYTLRNQGTAVVPKSTLCCCSCISEALQPENQDFICSFSPSCLYLWKYNSTMRKKKKKKCGVTMKANVSIILKYKGNKNRLYNQINPTNNFKGLKRYFSETCTFGFINKTRFSLNRYLVYWVGAVFSNLLYIVVLIKLCHCDESEPVQNTLFTIKNVRQLQNNRNTATMNS